MGDLPTKFTEWKLMAEAIKIDALREHEEYVASCARVLEQAVNDAEAEVQKKRSLVSGFSIHSPV